jgi:hypothetical protein
MANIATGFVRLIPKTNDFYDLPVGDILKLLLSSWEGKSYHVPIFVRQDEVTLVTDFQFGGKWGVTYEAKEVWYEYESVLEAIWLREYDAGGDHDRIMWLDHTDASYQQIKRCRYGFDSMRITWKINRVPDDFGLQWTKSENAWSLAVQGSYFAGNDRCSLGLYDPGNTPMKTLTTLTRGRGIEDELVWVLDEFQLMPTDLISHVQDSTDIVEFFWKGRLVRIQKREATIRYPSLQSKPGWHEYCLDDWDNCVDSDWLAFNEKPSQNHVTPPENDGEQTQ